MKIIIKEDEIKSMLEDIIFKLFQEKKDVFKDIVEEVMSPVRKAPFHFKSYNI